MTDGDAARAAGAPEREIVGRGAEDLRWGERLSLVAGSFWRQHARSIVAVLLIVGLVGGSTYGWVRAHPAPLAVPDLAVRATGVSTFETGDVAAGEIVRGALRVRLGLTVTVGDRADESIQFRGLSGAGMAPLISPVNGSEAPLGSAPRSEVTAPTRVDCGRWNGFSGVVAHFRLTRDDRTRDIEVPVNPVAEFEVSAAIQRPCAAYNQSHPVRVEGVTETLDTLLPIVHLAWQVANPTDVPYAIDGTGAYSTTFAASVVLPVSEATIVGAQQIPAHSSATVRSALAVIDCDTTEPISLSDAFFQLSGYIDTPTRDPNVQNRPLQIDLPEDETKRAESLSQQACSGAPHAVTEGLTVVAGAGGPGRVATATLNGQLVPAAGAGSSPAAASAAGRVWLAVGQTYLATSGSVPLGGVRADVDSGGNFTLVATWDPAGCDGTGDLSVGSVVHLVVSAGREYPYLVKVRSSSIVTGCTE